MLDKIKENIIGDYSARFSDSQKSHLKFLEYLPGGNTKSLSYFKPFPVHIERGEGAYVFSSEGEKLLDVINGYGALIHGHADPEVHDEVAESLKRGTQFSAPTEAQFGLAAELCRRTPSIEKIRFTNSGTEATLFALRAARTYTGRDKIIKMTGGYHGTHDCVARAAQKEAVTSGIPRKMVEDVIEVPFNDPTAFEAVIEQHGNELAAVIVEPFLGAGGIVPAADGYLQVIRRLTEQHGIVLILDEVLSHRIAYGGAQSLADIRPDLTTLGKAIGGGFPIGAFGGRTEIMDAFCSVQRERPLYHSGTFNGSEVAMVAGLASLRKYEPEQICRLDAIGTLTRDKLRTAIEGLCLSIQVTQIHSLLKIHFTNVPIVNSETADTTVSELGDLLQLSLLNKGVYSSPRNVLILSTAMSEDDIELLVGSIEQSLSDLKPGIVDRYPQLLA